MRILALDPGPEKTAYVLYDGKKVVEFGIPDNESLIQQVREWAGKVHELAIEGVQCFGMPVGSEVFATCVWIGRYMEVFGADDATIVYRKDVKLHLCGSMRAKDPMIRQSLIDRFGPGKEKAIGVKKTPGPLYGVSSHCWSALAVAVTYWDTKRLAQAG